MFIDKALEAAGLYPTEENTAMVKELLSLNMPVNMMLILSINIWHSFRIVTLRQLPILYS